MANELYTIDPETGVITTNPVLVGVDPKTNLNVYRRFRLLFSDVYDGQKHSITYEQWRVDVNGDIDTETIKYKSYLVKDIPATYDSEGNVLTPAISAYTQWFLMLAPTLIPAINGTLQALPIDAPDNYVLNQPE